MSEKFRALQFPQSDCPDGKQRDYGQVMSAETARALREASVCYTNLPRPRRDFWAKKRPRIVWLLFGLFIGVVLIREINPLSRPRVTRANFARIQQGMTFDQVQAILGAPPGDYTGGRCEPAENYTPSFGKVGRFIAPPGLWREPPHAWTTYEGYIDVGFDQRGRATEKYFDDVVSVDRNANTVWVNPPRRYIDRVLGLLGL